MFIIARQTYGWHWFFCRPIGLNCWPVHNFQVSTPTSDHQALCIINTRILVITVVLINRILTMEGCCCGPMLCASAIQNFVQRRAVPVETRTSSTTATRSNKTAPLCLVSRATTSVEPLRRNPVCRHIVMTSCSEQMIYPWWRHGQARTSASRRIRIYRW